MNIEYTLKRSQRKTLAIHIIGKLVEVRAPMHLAQSEIDSFVARKEKWITEKLAGQTARPEKGSVPALRYGDKLLYRGREYPVVAGDNDLVRFSGASFVIPPDLPPLHIKGACEVLYRLMAKGHIPDRTFELADKMGVMPNEVKINGARTRWGSCTSLKNINFSWRCIMADDDLIDYLIVHELTHLKDMSHSKAYWKLVESVLPDYEDLKWRLRLCQLRIRETNWDKFCD